MTETPEQIAERIAREHIGTASYHDAARQLLKADILAALRNERERAIRIINQFAGCRDHDQPTHCVDCDLRHKAIAAIKAERVANVTENMQELCDGHG